jgi:hypothetical protein
MQCLKKNSIFTNVTALFLVSRIEPTMCLLVSLPHLNEQMNKSGQMDADYDDVYIMNDKVDLHHQDMEEKSFLMCFENIGKFSLWSRNCQVNSR